MRKSALTVYIGVTVLLHIAAVVVAVHSVKVARSFWGQFLSGPPFPTLYLFVIGLAHWLPAVALAVLVACVLIGCKATDRTALHFLVGVMALSIAILSVTAIGVGQPMSVATGFMQKKSVNQASQTIGAKAELKSESEHSPSRQ